MRATLTGILRDSANAPLADLDVCVVDRDPLVYCATTSATGQFEIADVPATSDQVLSVDGADRKWLLSFGRHQEQWAYYGCELDSVAQFEAARQSLGIAPKSGTGQITLLLLGASSDAVPGATARSSATDADGPNYSKADGSYDKTLTKAEGRVLRWFNVAPGVHEVTIETPKAMTCSPYHAWGKGDGQRFKVKVQADRGTTMAVICR